MNQNCKAAMAAAVAGGYLLGRTKKAKLALAVGTYLAGRRFSMSPTQLATQGLTKLRETPQFQDLADQVRHEVVEAGRAAVTAAARRKLLDLSDSLRDRGERLSGAAEGRGDEDADDRDDRDDEDDAYDEEPSGEDREEDADDYADEDGEDEEDDDGPAAGAGVPRRTSAGSAGLRNSAADRGSARRATVRRAASTGPAVANAAVKKKTAARSGSASGSGSRRGK
ncbi:hypothetical protein [Streptomyces fragilis]|uniref:DNA primase n=1 Tax=Streptomyces fragilis TaxID=67301 RepID=A0ABV2YLM4_9ACTN|nr:hypothetical protein [Streptomyces fragilis]